jgi:hypothetical protein
MKIMKMTTHPDSLRELRLRKAELKVRLDAEQATLRSTWQELRSDLKPSHLMASFAKSLLGPSEQPGTSGMAANLQGPLRMATDLLIGGSRTKLLLNIALPLVLTYLPRLTQKAKGISFDKSKAKVYGTLRKGIAGLRSQIKRKKDIPLQVLDAGDIIQPS